MSRVLHTIEPVYNSQSKILILGSFPSVKSRENNFYYGHPQNRFWKVLSSVFNGDLPVTNEQKKAFLLENHIALWDVIGECEIEGSADSSIKSVVPNDISAILNKTEIKRIYVNGKTAERYYKKYIQNHIGIQAVCLPSTSPANASKTLEALKEEWKVITY
ncbi:MAG: DNA-deoxyinosine glycosylase [Ruminococcus sp.]|nr:DNA-deoxyinosine glycosylase [Candidatus Copronaster equi]